MIAKANDLIFIADNDKFCLQAYKRHLNNLGMNAVSCFTSCTELIKNLSDNPGLIFLDYEMGECNGHTLLKRIKGFNPAIYVVVISSQQNPEVAVDLLKDGAFDYIVKDGNELERINKIIVKWKSDKVYNETICAWDNSPDVRKNLVKTLIEAEEKIRKEISGELHDNINQLLGATKLYIETACRDEENRLTLIIESKDIIETAIAEIRKISHGLFSLGSDGCNLEEKVLKIITDLKNQKNITISSEIEIDNVNDLFYPYIQQNVLRIVQELINNAMKYSGAGKMHIGLKLQYNKLFLKISDDGIGFNASTVKRGLGLQSILERLSKIKGAYCLTASPGAGCNWEIQVPANIG